MRIPIKNLAGNRRILSGAQAGRQLLAALVADTPPCLQPEPAFLDFSGVEVATSSFLRESIIAFRDHARASLDNVYPVVANAVEAVREELEFFVRQRGDALWCCTLDAAGDPSGAYVLGDLDTVEKATFALVSQLGSTSAPELASRWSDGPKIGATAWNNRLTSLSAKGLLVKRRAGKTNTFSLLLEVF